MAAALSDQTHQYFDIPDDVVQVRMDFETGKLASENAVHAASALFKKGTEPRDYH